MNDLRWVLWGFGVQDLALAAGQTLVCVAAFFLAMKHAVWLKRGRWQFERRRERVWRAWVEMIVAAFVTILYAQQIAMEMMGRTPATRLYAELSGFEATLQIWAFGILFLVLLFWRGERHDQDE